MSKPTSANKQIGDRGEAMAAQWLQQQGYTLLDRNFRRRCGEIDIIAAKGGVTYFVEVKTRRRNEAFRPADNVDARKRQQIAKTAAQWFAERGQETASGFLTVEVLLDRQQIAVAEDFLLG